MTGHLNRFLRDSALAMAAAAIAVGCATTEGGRAHQAKSDRPQDLRSATAEQEPREATAPPRSAAELLREAEQEFQTANAAQEGGDPEAALRHYNKMLELLVEADLDPAIFYNLRAELEQVLKGTPEVETAEAKLFPERKPDWTQKALEGIQIQAELTMPESLSDRVQVEIQEIQELYPRNFQYGLNRSTKYVPHIQAELQKAGLPPDLAWLAMVESQFTPKIVSRAGAGGMWQFMKGTGTRYGLRVDSYVDERYNWEKATQAAVMYLTELRDMFDGEWPLAVSAYNMGEYGMERAVAMNGGERDLAALLEKPPASNAIRTETKKFYPKLLASMIVAKDPERYGFKVEPQAPDNTARIPVNGCYSLAALDSACGLPEGTLHRLNPDLIRGVTPPTGQHAVAVPVEAQEKFQTALANVPQEKRSSIFSRGKSSSSKSETSSSSSSKSTGSTKSHTVKRGETLSSIAHKYGVDMDELREVNHIRSARRLFSGTRLTIPVKGGAAKEAEPAPAPEAESKPEASEKSAQAAEARTYVVKRGDTLFEIATEHGVSVKQLQEWNGLRKPSDLRQGETLKLGPGEAVAAASAKAPEAEPLATQTYKVQRGDYPAKIAQRYGITVEELLKSNKIAKAESIQIGQTLTICKAGPDAAPSSKAEKAQEAAEAPAKAETASHTVAAGDTAGKIASKYGVSTKDLLAWNDLKATSVLRPGQKLVVRSSGKAASKSSAPKAEPEKIVHKVTKGQNPSSIAQRYGVKLSDLSAWNGWKKAPVLQVGDEVVILKK